MTKIPEKNPQAKTAFVYSWTSATFPNSGTSLHDFLPQVEQGPSNQNYRPTPPPRHFNRSHQSFSRLPEPAHHSNTYHAYPAKQCLPASTSINTDSQNVAPHDSIHGISIVVRSLGRVAEHRRHLGSGRQIPCQLMTMRRHFS